MIPAPVIDPPRPARPATVTTAFWLQVTLVASLLALCVLNVVQTVHEDHLIDQAALIANATPDDVSDERSANLSGALVFGIPLLIFALWLGAAAWPVRRGSNVGRVLTLVGLALPVLATVVFCLFGAIAGGLLTLALFGAGDRVEELPPDESWYDAPSTFYDTLDRLHNETFSIVTEIVSTTFGVLAFLCAGAVAVLLLTSAATRFYRPQTATPPHQPGHFPPGHLLLPTPYPPAPYPPAPVAPQPPPYGYGYPAHVVTAPPYAPPTSLFAPPAPPSTSPSSPSVPSSPFAPPSSDSGPETGPTED